MISKDIVISENIIKELKEWANKEPNLHIPPTIRRYKTLEVNPRKMKITIIKKRGK